MHRPCPIPTPLRDLLLRAPLLALLASMPLAPPVSAQDGHVAHTGATATSAPAPDVDALLASGDLATAVTTLETWLAAHPDDQPARFGLGWARSLAAVERLAATLHRHGADPDMLGSLLSMTGAFDAAAALGNLPENPAPQPTTYADVRDLQACAIADLSAAAATLEACDLGDGGLVLHPGRFAMAPYSATPPVLFVRWMNLLPAQTDAELDDLEVRFDQADVRWLAGYLHALAVPFELLAAVDGSDVFEHAGHTLFPRAVQSEAMQLCRDDDNDSMWSQLEDVIAGLHMARLPVSEPERLAAAYTHMQTVLDHSDAMWASILAEGDDDREWVPSPSQSGPLGATLDEATLTTWRELLGEVRRLLDGETLMPFWRGPERDDRGVHLPRLFDEATHLDPVLWMQGTPAVPFLEHGEVTPLADGRLWRRLRTLFGGHPGRLALWVN